MNKYKNGENPGLDGYLSNRHRENRTANYKFTIVVPVFNEEENIYALEKNFQRL